MKNNLEIIILAAGNGTRMHSSLTKVLHPLGGITILEHILNTASALEPKKIHVVVGHHFEQIKNACKNYKINWVHQEKTLGTAHAVLQAMPYIDKSSDVLILCGDTPLIEAKTLLALINGFSIINILVANVEDPTGLGRIVRNNANDIIAITEEKDACENTKKIKEIYTGICFAKQSFLQEFLPQITNDNAQKEYYLTDLISLAIKNNIPVSSTSAKNAIEVMGINDKIQLHTAERALQLKIALQYAKNGVYFRDLNRVDFRGNTQFAKDVMVDINCIFIGEVSIASGVQIGPNCLLKNVNIGPNTFIHANSVIEDAVVGANNIIGPFARLRPGANTHANCHIGNFVEIKNATIDSDSKVNHLTYIGDSSIGKNVNIGAGTITCNYDGANKHKTIIEDNVFVGSGTQLIAPVTLEQGSTIGAGSTIRKNTPANTLTLTQATQKSIPGWQRPKKEKL